MTMDAALKQTRRVVDRCLVAATEPLSSSTLTDVVMLNDPAHVSDWPGRLAGAQIYDFEQAQLAIELGCTFIVSDANDSALTQQLAGWSRHGASPIWFVRGCRNSQHLRTLIHSGVRRVWVEPEPWKGLPNWDVQLAAAWSTDQNLGDLAAINALFAKEA
jgi:hypothetical protein